MTNFEKIAAFVDNVTNSEYAKIEIVAVGRGFEQGDTAGWRVSIVDFDGRPLDDRFTATAATIDAAMEMLIAMI